VVPAWQDVGNESKKREGIPLPFLSIHMHRFYLKKGRLIPIHSAQGRALNFLKSVVESLESKSA
jgi:hypothetical protein